MDIIVPFYLSLFLICYPHSCHMHTLLHFLIFVTLHVVTHYSCICVLCIAYMLLYVYVADFITVYAQHKNMVMLHTAHLHVYFYHVTTIQYYLLYKIGYYCRHDLMIIWEVVMVVKYDIFIFLLILKFRLYGIADT